MSAQIWHSSNRRSATIGITARATNELPTDLRVDTIVILLLELSLRYANDLFHLTIQEGGRFCIPIFHDIRDCTDCVTGGRVGESWRTKKPLQVQAGSGYSP